MDGKKTFVADDCCAAGGFHVENGVVTGGGHRAGALRNLFNLVHSADAAATLRVVGRSALAAAVGAEVFGNAKVAADATGSAGAASAAGTASAAGAASAGPTACVYASLEELGDGSIDGRIREVAATVAPGGTLILEALADDPAVTLALHAQFSSVNFARPHFRADGELPSASAGGAGGAGAAAATPLRRHLIAQRPYLGATWGVRAGAASTVAIAPDRVKVIKRRSAEQIAAHPGALKREAFWLKRLAPTGFVPALYHVTDRALVMSYVGEPLTKKTDLATDWANQLLSIQAGLAGSGCLYGEWANVNLCVRAVPVGGAAGTATKTVPARFTLVGFGRVPLALADTTCAGAAEATPIASAPTTFKDLVGDFSGLP